MCSWSDSGDPSNMKKYTCGPTTQSPRRGIRSPVTSAFTIHADHIRALTGKHPIRPTSPRFRRSRQLEPGRRSTYPLKILFRQTEPPQFPDVGSKMLFLFDYGDEWLFKVEMVGMGEKVRKARYPKVIKSMGTAPRQYPDPDAEFEDE